MPSDEFKNAVIDKHGGAFNTDVSEAELKSGVQINYEYALNKQLERIGICRSIMARDNYIQSVEHLLDMLIDDVEKHEDVKRQISHDKTQAEKFIEGYKRKNLMLDDTDIRFQCANLIFRSLMKLMKRCGYLPKQDVEI